MSAASPHATGSGAESRSSAPGKTTLCGASRRLLPFVGLIVAHVVAPAGLARAAPAIPVPQQRQVPIERLLVGAIVHDEEVAAFEVLHDGEDYLVPVQQFVTLCGCELTTAEGASWLVTPLGRIGLHSSDIVRHEGVSYLRQRRIESRLATPIRYAADRVALVFELPWRPGAPLDADRALGDPASIDSRAPGNSFSRLQGEVGYQARNDADNSGAANMVVGGRLARGRWRMRVREDTHGNTDLREYAWSRAFGRRLLLVGHQQVQVHPLASALELTGLQAAWTNQPLETFRRSADARELLPRQLRSTRTISGAGPPAGVAELRVDDRIVARRRIGLDGLYEFRDVALPRQRTSRVEVRVFDRFDVGTPVEIHEHTRRVSGLLLPRGALVVQGGLGRAGNLAGELVGPATPGQGAGFFQVRWGAGDRLSLEAVGQSVRGHTQLIVGAVGAADFATGAASVGVAGGRVGYALDVEGDAGRWRWVARAREEPAGFRVGLNRRTWDRFVEVSRRFGRSLELGMVVRDSFTTSAAARFALPAGSWRPARALVVRARPDFAGEYRLDLSWAIDRASRVGISRAGDTTHVAASRRLLDRLHASAFGEVLDDGRNREGLALTWSAGYRTGASWTAGALLTNGRPGALLGAQLSLRPGVLLTARFESDTLVDAPLGTRNHRLLVTVTGNLAVSGRRFIPAGSLAFGAELGGITGRLVVAADYDVDPEALAGATIYVDGRPAGATGPGGSFHVDNLARGVYRVELDVDGLPIELVPRSPAILAEVAGGTVTRADFELDVRFGIAGRVERGDAPWPGVSVELLDAGGAVVSTATTDRFGLYRIDDLPIGDYTLRLVAGEGSGIGRVWRPVRIVDGFLFDQDLRVEDR